MLRQHNMFSFLLSYNSIRTIWEGQLYSKPGMQSWTKY